MLGDQPGVTAAAVQALIASRGDAPLAACAYDNGRGHPLAFARIHVRTTWRRCTATRACGSCSIATPRRLSTSRSPARSRATSTPTADYRALLSAQQALSRKPPMIPVIQVDAQTIARQSSARRKIGSGSGVLQREDEGERHRRCDLILIGASTGWVIGLVLGVIVAAGRCGDRDHDRDAGPEDRGAGANRRRGRGEGPRPDGRRSPGSAGSTTPGVRILHSARALRKVAVGK